MAPRPRAVVLGMGILGTLAAEHLSRNFEVLCLGLGDPDHEAPPTDSQRNQAWLQSGMLYVRTPEVALRIRHDGQYLARRYRMPVESSQGIFAWDEERLDAIRAAEELAAMLGFSSTFREITRERARRQLGLLFSPNKRYYRVPDAPFDEGGLIDQARDEAKFWGAQFVALPSPAHVQLADSGRARVITTDGRVVDADVVVVCAGYETPRIANALQLNNLRFTVSRSVLLTVADRPMLDCELFADRSLDLSVVQHYGAREFRSLGYRRGRVVLGNGHRVVQGDEPARVVTREEQLELLDLLPEELRKRYESEEISKKWTAGFKTEEASGSVAHSVHGPSSTGISNLIIAVPGKATAAAAVAHDVLNLAFELTGTQERSESTITPDEAGRAFPGMAPGRTSLHFEKEYDEHNDSDA